MKSSRPVVSEGIRHPYLLLSQPGPKALVGDVGRTDDSLCADRRTTKREVGQMVLREMNRAEIERKPLMPVVWFVLVAILWVAFGAALVTSAGGLDELWTWVRDQSTLIQGVMWVLLLPWMVALAIWESSWVLWVKLTLIAGLAAATLYMFLPRSA